MARKRTPPKPTEVVRTEVSRTSEQSRFALKRKVRYFYDLQELRIQTHGRVNKNNPHGIDLHIEDLNLLETRAKDLAKFEREALYDIRDHLRQIPFYNKVLNDPVRYRGVGPTMAGVILSSFDIAREDTPSKMWAFAGLRPMPCKRCKHCFSVVLPIEGGRYKHATNRRDEYRCKVQNLTANDVIESAQSQRPTAGEKLPYNAWLRTKLIGVLGPVLLRCGSPWRRAYDDCKHRKMSQGWGRSDGHRHQAAIRFMVKMLLLDIWREWRIFEGLPIREPYAVEYLKKTPHDMSHYDKTLPDSTPETEAEIEAELELLDTEV